MDEALQALGLTAAEARAYRGLLHGPRDARSLSSAVLATYPGIYRTLEALVRKGWVRVQGTHPRQFTAIPPSEASRSMRETAIRRLDEALRDLAVKEGFPAPPPDLAVIKGFDAALAAIGQMAASAEDPLFCVTPGPLDAEVVAEILQALGQAHVGVEWYLNVANRGDVAAHGAGPQVRALAVIPKARQGPTRLEHTFLFSGRSRMLTLDAAYRDGRLDRAATHALALGDVDIVRTQLEALVEATRALAGRPVPAP